MSSLKTQNENLKSENKELIAKIQAGDRRYSVFMILYMLSILVVYTGVTAKVGATAEAKSEVETKVIGAGKGKAASITRAYNIGYISVIFRPCHSR